MLVATCDDELDYCDQVERYIQRLGATLGIEVQCDKYQSGTQLLNSDYEKYQIIFLDINLDDKEDGLSVAKQIRQNDQKSEIVFLTALAQYAVAGYMFRAYRFLTKPVQYDQFVYQLQELMERIDFREKSTLKLIKDGQEYSINIGDILYVEVMNHTLIYHCTKGCLSISGNMKKAERELRGQSFARIHNSFLVNMKYIADVKSQEVILCNQERLPLARGKRDSFRIQYLDFWGDELA